MEALDNTPETLTSETGAQNIFQEVSAATHGVITPGNVLTTLGGAISYWGLNHLDSNLGVAATGGGFMIDVTDGWAARKSKTANDIGAAYDASLDKVKLAYALSKMYQDDLVPKPLLAAVALQNGFNAALTVADRAINKPPVLEVDRLGKRAMFFTQWGLGIHVIGTSLERNGKPAGRYVKMGGTALAGAGLALGVAASNKYHRTFMVSRTTSRMVPRSQTNHE